MASEEKRAWIMAVVAVGGYAVYLIVILGRAGGGPLTEVPYVGALLWTIGGGMLAGIVLTIATGIFNPKEAGKKDERDREINRFGETIGQSFIVIGGVTALGMSMAELDHFWISNVIYLAFVLSALLASIAKIVAYRRGFQTW